MRARQAGGRLHVVEWGGRRITYQLVLEARRDLAITVHPDLRVTVLAPDTKPIELITRRIHAKRSWIAHQLRAFERIQPLPSAKRYVSGETFRYLGRQYRLRVRRGTARVTLAGGYLTVLTRDTTDALAVSRAVQRWYCARAREVLVRRFDVGLLSMEMPRGVVPHLRVRQMRRRWGSCTARGTITLNPSLLQAPLSCIDYVIAHELLHAVEPSHSRKFFRLLGRAIPEWRERRRRLGSYGPLEAA